MTLDLAVVLGTWNRLPLLQRCISSVRSAAAIAPMTYRIVVVDGGSTDLTIPWLTGKHLFRGEDIDDVDVIEQHELLGAVKAFNAGFAWAVEREARYIAVLNDDDELLDPFEHFSRTMAAMDYDPDIGAIAYETDLRGPWQFEEWCGKPYCNKGIVRRQALMAVARAQGDPEGKCYWSRDHLTYASDTEAGLWIWRLGWRVERGYGLRVHDESGKNPDDLRKRNVAQYVASGTVKLFHQRWGNPRAADYHREDAAKFGGRIL